MHERILIAGAGGQGVVLIGKTLAMAAVRSVPHITFFPSYGAEVRGGTSNCQVVLSSAPIASPVREAFDAMIIMNDLSAERFGSLSADGGLKIRNTPQPRKLHSASCIAIDATGMANDLGNPRAGNFVLLGVLVGRRHLVPPEAIEEEIRKNFAQKAPSLLELNMRAFQAGLTYEGPPAS